MIAVSIVPSYLIINIFESSIESTFVPYQALVLRIVSTVLPYLSFESTHGRISVLVLGPVALAQSHETRRYVCDSNRAVGSVHMLPPCTLRPHGVNLQFFRRDLDVRSPSCSMPDISSTAKTRNHDVRHPSAAETSTFSRSDIKKRQKRVFPFS